MKRRILISLVLALTMIAAATVLLGETGTSRVLSSPEAGTTRIIHASPDSPAIDLLIDDTAVFTDVAFGDITDYIAVSAGTHTVTLQTHGDDTPLLTELLNFAASDHTLAAAGMSSALELLKFVDDNRTPGPGMVRGRLVHLSPGAPAVDVATDDGAVLFSNLGYRDAGDYVEVLAGTFELEIRLAGTTIVLDTTSLTVRANRVYSMFAIGTPSNLEFVQIVDQAYGSEVYLPLVVRGG